MARQRKQAAPAPEVVDPGQYSLEQYTTAMWLAAEAEFKGEELPEPVAGPPPEPHPNEIATREAVESNAYAAQDVGVEV